MKKTLSTLLTLSASLISVGVHASPHNQNASLLAPMALHSSDFSVTVADTDIHDISRYYFNGYDLDDVDIVLRSSAGISLVNHSPRYLNRPLIQVNDKIIRVNNVVAPFTRLDLDVSGVTQDPISNAHFVEEQPFFKANVREYVDIKPHKDKFAMPTAHNVYQYEKEMRGLKQVFNNYTYNYEFVDFIEQYMSRFSLYSRQYHEEEWCEAHNTRHKRALALSPSDDYISYIARDNASNTVKHISMLANKPLAKYTMLTRAANGLATTNNGWLSVRDFRLFREGATSPKTTYMHEKMHNHGFGHKGGMTYGYPAKTGEFVNQYWDNFYVDGIVEQTTPTLAVMHNTKDLGNEVEVVLQLLDKEGTEASSRSIDKFMLLTTDSMTLNRATFNDIDGQTVELQASRVVADGNTYVFDNIPALHAQTLEKVNTQPNAASTVSLFFDKPSSAISSKEKAPTSLVFIGGSSEDFYQQSNLILNYSNALGYRHDNDQFVYSFKEYTLDENNTFVEQNALFTPQQAENICQEKGMTLGMLQPFKSSAMISFQNKFLKYGSQVGLSHETGEPVAVNIPTSYKKNLVKVVDKGSLIVCQG
ncbi:hypothetical protein [Veronia pacifica]|uniref:Uncharacterized protein n=1 Tax=Veronia pacifica TaxID=1080227 RepID=A0A1C3EJA3_9GAMM|nr:hypothetical protein [Veronia pacifica]ODA33299.1 hypothetical protein A8L45_10900 [Veronia pacifica]